VDFSRLTIPQANLRPILRATAREWRANLNRVMARAHFILGDELRAFEQEFALKMGARFAIGVSSGSAAIELSLREAGIRGEVLTTALTAPFTAVSIKAAGCTPRFCDVDPETLQIDAADAARRVTRKTRAIVPVHLYGQPCDMRTIEKIGLPVIQDACQSHGARVSFLTPVAYSFYPTKNLGALGDGGAIVTNSASIAKRLRMLRDGGRDSDQIAHIEGINARLDEMQCCFLRAFLPHLDEWNAHRAKIAAVYDEALGDCRGVRLVRGTKESVNHLYVIRAERRDALKAHLAASGIGTAIHYPVPLHQHPAFAQKISLPHAERAVNEILSLPLWPYMKESDARKVARAIRKFYS
jgi:dTDP-3-amino-3,4,6-trideoxy-alpha-D-glucose transaminase